MGNHLTYKVRTVQTQGGKLLDIPKKGNKYKDTPPEYFYATAGQTVFTTVYQLVTNPSVYVNDVIQYTGYSRLNDNQIEFTTGLNLNDKVVIKN